MWRFFEKNFMLDLTCSLAHVHTVDVCVYPFFGTIFSESIQKRLFLWSMVICYKTTFYIYIYIYILP